LPNIFWRIYYKINFKNVTRFAKTGLVCTKWQGTLFTCYTNELIIHVYIYHYQRFTDLLFLGPFSQACLTCSSTWVVFKWQWCEWTSIHPTGNLHTTGQWTWESNWLLFVISRVQMGIKWDHFALFSSYRWKNLPFMAPHPPTFTPMQGCWKQLKSGKAINTKYDGIFLKKDCTKLLEYIVY